MIYAYFFRSLLLSFNWGCFIVTVAGYLQGGAPMILPPDNLHPCVAVSRWDLMISFWWTECSRRDGMPRDRSGYKKMLASTLGTLSLWGKSHSMLWFVQRIGLELRPSELSSTNTQWSELGSESFLSWNLRWLQPWPIVWLQLCETPLARGIRLCSVQIPDQRTLEIMTVYYFKSLSVGIICYSATDNEYGYIFLKIILTMMRIQCLKFL